MNEHRVDAVARTARRLVIVALVGGLLGGGLARPAASQESGRRELARELAQLLLDPTMRRGIDEQVARGMVQATAIALQERLDRRLLEVEWQMLAGIVQRFVSSALPPHRTEELAAEAYARHFDEAELRELLRFQRSPVGRKSGQLAPVIALETFQAIDRELRASPAAARMLAELRGAFPVLGASESP